MFFPLMIYNARSFEKESREVESMSTGQICKSIVRALCQQRNAVYFFSGYEIPYLEKTVDRSGRDRERTGTEYYPGTDR